MFVEFVIQNQLFSYSLENFAQILGVPCEGACIFSDRWRVDELIYGIPTDGLYQTNLPPVKDIVSSIRFDHDGQVCRIRHEEEIDVLEYQVLTRKIEPSLKPLEEIILEKVKRKESGEHEEIAWHGQYCLPRMIVQFHHPKSLFEIFLDTL
ncbi:hypothetical protein Tco_0696501 [Tanacetum coccineum]